jgi:NAD(P)-dependent dehydrogenase (short-subunit alcohol dehydrogenase family)
LVHSSNRDSKDSDPFQDRLSAPAVTEAERHRVPEWFRGLENKRMLVTGAAGFIGGALFERLASYGCDVTGTVLYAHEAEALREQGLKSEVLDLASDEPFDRHVQGIDIVFHVAAMFQETEHGEAMYRKVNDEGALKLEAGALEPSRSGNRARRRVGRIAFGPERTCMVTPTKLRDAARSGAIAPSDGRRGPCKSRS